MTMRLMVLFLSAGLALAGCSKRSSLAGSAHDASAKADLGAGDAGSSASAGDAGSSASTGDAGSSASDGILADGDVRTGSSDGKGSDSRRTGPDASTPDADNNWTLPHNGGPVWQNSTVPYCGTEDGYIGNVGDLWSDSRGVYLIRTVPPNHGLYFNAGSGWSRVSPQPRTTLSAFTGIPAGPLLLYDNYQDSTCGVTSFDGTTESCLASVAKVSNVFAFNAQRVFAITDDRLLTLSGNSYFTGYATIPTSEWPSYQLWADSQVVVVADRSGNAFLFDDAAADPEVVALPDGMVADSLWGFGRDDLWVGDDTGRLAHYDGDSWTVLQAAHGNCLDISWMWGAEHVLYFATQSSVGRWKDGNLDTVLDGPCLLDPEPSAGTYEQVEIENIWGNSPTELFIAVQERKETKTLVGSNGATYSEGGPDSCGQFRIYWFDGQRLGRL